MEKCLKWGLLAIAFGTLVTCAFIFIIDIKCPNPNKEMWKIEFLIKKHDLHLKQVSSLLMEKSKLEDEISYLYHLKNNGSKIEEIFKNLTSSFPFKPALSRVGNLIEKPGKGWDECLRFRCSQNVQHCNNSNSTNLDDQEPPCCSHIARDITIIASKLFKEHDIEHFIAFTTLLSVYTTGNLIPNILDVDIAITARGLQKIERIQEILRKKGLSWINDGYDDLYRICVNKEFADGKLFKKWYDKTYWGDYQDNFPYIDLYRIKLVQWVNWRNASYLGESISIATSKCLYDKAWIVPLQTLPFYDETVFVPANPHAVLSESYGNYSSQKFTLHDLIYCKSPLPFRTKSIDNL